MNSQASRWQDLIVPGAVITSWLAFAAEKKISPIDLVRQAGLVKENVASFDAGVSMLKFQRLMLAVRQHTGDDGVGFEVGWRMPPTAYGSLGHAMLSSANLRDALEVCQRFWHLMARGIVLDVVLHEGQYVMSCFLQFPMRGAARRIALESLVTSMYRGIVLLDPSAAAASEVWLDYPEPSYSARIRQRIPNVRFGMPMVQCRLSADVLDRPSPMASTAGRLAAVRQCEQEERALNLFGKHAARVQKELGYRAFGYPTLEKLAELLGMATRTLRRKLQEEGTSYSQLLDSARLRDAILLLENPTLAIVLVAEQLGYNDPANFTRAFRKWTGMAPSQYRSQACAP